MDAAHELTEREINRLSRRIGRVYSKAHKEAKSAYEKLLADYKRERAERLKALDDSKEARKKFDEWCKAESLLVTQRGMVVDQLAYDLTLTDIKAREIADDALPNVYAKNYDYSIGQIETQLLGVVPDGFGVSFSLVDESTARMLITENPRLLPIPETIAENTPAFAKAVAYNKRQITTAITQGILQGESIPNISKRIGQVYGRGADAATRYARTACTCAENAGRLQSYRTARDMGIELVKEWVATGDKRTRQTHLEADGQKVPIDEPFTVGGSKLMEPGDPSGNAAEVWNCFIGSTLVATDSEVQRSYKHAYSGDVLTVHTASGVEFTCTPNHPVMTAHGWVPVSSLDKGSNVLVASVDNDFISGVDPDVDKVHSSIEAIHDFLNLSGERIASLDVNFHGDVPASEVEIVSKEGLLGDDGDASGNEVFGELWFEHPDALATGGGVPGLFLVGHDAPTNGIMGGGGVGAPFLWGHLRHADAHGLGAVAGGNTALPKDAVHDGAADSEIECELLDGRTVKVRADKVISIEISSFNGHVYNLQTGNGYYYASNNGNRYIIAHNCRCTMRARVEGFNESAASRSHRAEIEAERKRRNV